MSRRGGEARRVFTVVFVAAGALLSFAPFLWNLAWFLVAGRPRSRRIREFLAAGGEVPVDEPPEVASSKRVYVIAGEDSGDLHAANLVAALRERTPEVELCGMGGPRMAGAGCRLDFDLVRMNVMGVWPVVRAVGTYFRLFLDFLRMLETEPPDVLVPVDYPGFNLRAARLARRRGIRVVYYIAPQVWAWAPWRLRAIARSVDSMIVILPFERRLFREGGVPAVFVGHPLYEHLSAHDPARSDERPWPPRSLGLLPGSRRKEVEQLLPVMLDAARELLGEHPGIRIVLPYRQAAVRPVVDEILARCGAGLHVELVEGRTHEVMRDLDLALVASGTATLELAYYGVPMVVLYRLGKIASLLKRFVLIVPDIGLVNIVAGRRIVPERIGARGLATGASENLLRWMRDEAAYRACRRNLAAVRDRLLFTDVSKRAAGWVMAAGGRVAGADESR